MIFLFYFYLLVNLLAILLALSKFRTADSALRIICFFLILNMLDEILAKFSAYRWHNNSIVYNSYAYISFVVISIYFNFSNDIFRRRNAGFYIAAVGTAAGAVNQLYVQKKGLNVNLVAFNSVIIIIMALFTIARYLLTDSPFKLLQNPRLWISVIFAFSWSMTYCYLALYSFNEAKSVGIGNILVGTQIVCNIFSHLAFAIIFVVLLPSSRSYRYE